MNSATYRVMRSIIAALLLLGAAVLAIVAGDSPARAQTLGQHCYDVGPLPEQPPDWCGCTWGAVYVDRKPVAGAQVTVMFAGRALTAASRLSAVEPFPFYALSARELGAKYGDVVTLTVTYRGESLARAVRLLPNGASGEQQASFAFPASGHWERWTNTPNVQALATQGNDLWVGTAVGLFRWNIATGSSETHPIGLAAESIQALAIGQDGSVWAGTPAGLARYHNNAWTPQAAGLASANIRGLAVAPDGSVWAGASGATTGGVSRFDGAAWQPQTDFNEAAQNLVLALAADDRGHIWVGTDDAGVSRWDGTVWQTYGAADGLASNIVYDIAAEPGAVWFGTFAYTDGTGAHGGAGRYDLATGEWTRYTQVDGLASDDVAAVAVDAVGRKWFGTWGGGLSLFDGRNWWTFDEASDLGSNFVRALMIGPDGSLWVGGRGSVDRFRPGPGGTPPLITAANITPAGLTLTFQAHANDPDGGEIVSYEWRSDLDGVLGSEAAFNFSLLRLTPGLHRISVRAVDQAGAWSAVRTLSLSAARPPAYYLPLVTR